MNKLAYIIHLGDCYKTINGHATAPSTISIVRMPNDYDASDRPTLYARVTSQDVVSKLTHSVSEYEYGYINPSDRKRGQSLYLVSTIWEPDGYAAIYGLVVSAKSSSDAVNKFKAVHRSSAHLFGAITATQVLDKNGNIVCSLIE